MSDSLCLMTSFHLQHTWDLPAESPGCVMLLRASLGSKLLLSINYWGKHASKGKADGKNRKERLCRCHHCGACLRPGVSLLYCIKQVCKYSQKWPTPASPTTYLWGFWRVVASSCFISSTSCRRPPPLCFLLFLIPSPVRQDGSDEGLQVALNPFRSKMHRALGTSRKGWNESLNLFKRR